MKQLIKPALLLVIVAFCIFEFVLHSQSGIFREFEAAFLSLQWMVLLCFAAWCGTFLFLTFSLNDLPLIGLLLIAIAAYFISYSASQPATDVITLLAGVTLGKGVRVLLSRSSRRESAPSEKQGIDQSGLTSAATFLIGLVVLLAFSSWWHSDMMGPYHGPRWMGLWDNPNDYGILMGAGFVLSVGLLAAKRHKEAANRKSEIGNRKSGGGWNLLRSLRSFAAKSAVGDSRSLSLRIVLFIAAFIMGVGLVFSYSRGAWVGAVVGLLYLAKAYGKFKWRWVLPPVLVAVMVICFFWNNTPDSAPWYLKRMDLSRPSAQHRVAAWKAGFEIMRDHPFGVGWNKAVATYGKNYSPPEGGAAAITTNDYLMLGTQLGLPGLICFVGYVALCFRNRPNLVAADVRRLHLKSVKLEPPHVGCHSSTGSEEEISAPLVTCHSSLQTACRAGALAMLVAFWFDGGLFKLVTAAVFWILLELSQMRNVECGVRNQTNLSLVPALPESPDGH